ncbi:putative quinol monooxygenase [Enterobacter roggenkampii]|uniref:putative quinol monooxygenase n=1 Tax=Enterobacter roggenkampii TaxID=1812935 RepID=UPI002DB6A3DB|nr:putative quinol monooxygenase [Enterobacter roggenkampii]MEB5887492.1 antibiotic biosynthesis monooxygenase [Enterobacter roggenkampii]
MSDTEVISIIAVLKAKPGKIDALKQALQVLLQPTRREPGNIEYTLFQLRDSPDVFYVRESWRGQAGLDEHIALPHFQTFILQMNELLAEPLRLDYLKQIEA